MHNSDTTYNQNLICEWLDKNPQVKLFIQNLTFYHPRAFVLPIGQANSIWEVGNKLYWCNTDTTNKSIEILKTYCSNTHPSRNQMNNLQHSKIFNLDNTNYENYVNHLCKSKFVICPPGNGPDTHRLWETLNAKAIPIVSNTPFIEQLIRCYPDLPIVIVDNFLNMDFDSLKYNFNYTPYVTKKYWEKLILENNIKI